MVLQLGTDSGGIGWLQSTIRNQKYLPDLLTAKADRHDGRSPNRSATNRQKKEPHWLTWRTGNTPSVSDKRPSPGRAVSAGSRIQSPGADILDLGESQLRPASVVPRINTPSPARTYPSGYRMSPATPAASICNTPTPQRVDTPASLTADHRDYLADRQVAPVDVVLKPVSVW